MARNDKIEKEKTGVGGKVIASVILAVVLAAGGLVGGWFAREKLVDSITHENVMMTVQEADEFSE